MVKVHENQLRFLCTFLVNKTGGAYDKYYRAEEMECFGNSVQSFIGRTRKKEGQGSPGKKQLHGGN